MLNEILIRRKNCVYIPSSGPLDRIEISAQHVGTILKNLEAYGYTLSAEVIVKLYTLKLPAAKTFYTDITLAIRELLGANKTFNPMYPNFPRQVMVASAAELYINAIIHYFGNVVGLRILPDYEKVERPPLLENIQLTVLGLADDTLLHGMFRNLMESKTSISETDKADLTWYASEYAGNINLPNSIPNKEVMAFLAQVFGLVAIQKHIKTATDLLRIAVALSDGDISLATPTKFRSFKRRERRILLGALNSIVDPSSDMVRHRMMWIRLGEKLHPGEYTNKFPAATQNFRLMRSKRRVTTDRSTVELALEQGNALAALDILVRKPGELARRLDHLLRLCQTTAVPVGPITQAFENVAIKVSTPVLLQVAAHFQHRNEPNDLRVVFPKGNVAKVKVLPNDIRPLHDHASKVVQAICHTELLRRFAETSPIPAGAKVYLDPALAGYLVPFSQRSASRALHTIVRGSRLALGMENTLRFFIWWRDMSDGCSVDVDLSVVFFDENWNCRDHVSYTKLRSRGIYHSGDIVSAPQGACEFIDMDLKLVQQNGYRYALPMVLSYSGQAFTDMPECFFGWMARECPDSGEIFEPTTVAQKIDLSADTKLCIPCVIDMETSQLVWSDIALSSQKSFRNNVESNMPSLGLMGKALTQLRKPNLAYLFGCHGRAKKVEWVQTPEAADVVFAVDQGLTPFDSEEISALWL